MATALVARLLWCLLLGHAAVVVSTRQQQPIPACPQLRVHLQSRRNTITAPGGSLVLAVKLANKNARTLSGIGVRLDLPAGLVTQQETGARAPLVVDGGSTAYWTGLTLKPGKRCVLKLKARACGTATAGSFPMGGAVYLVNASNAVACLIPMATKNQLRVVTSSKGSGAWGQKAPPCSTPAPTPTDGPGYTLYGQNQILANGVLAGYTGRRRVLVQGEDSATASACQTLCSGAGFTPPFYFSVERTGDEACYCSQNNVLVYDASYDTYKTTKAGSTTTAPTTTPSASPSSSPSAAPTIPPPPTAAPTKAPTPTPLGIIWTSRNTTLANNWRSVAFGNNIFVSTAASGTGPRVMTSPDGTTWTSRNTTGLDLQWQCVTFGQGLFLSVATSLTMDSVMTSPDGIDWTLRNSSRLDNGWNAVTYANDLFVAIGTTGTGNRVMTSPDGITWTSRNTTGFDNAWRAITSGNGLFVATAQSGAGNRVMTSPDGINWTSRNTTGLDNSWNGVCWGNNLFVAVASSGTGNRVMTSPDGITWTGRNTTGLDNAWRNIVWTNALFVVVGSSGTGKRVMTSPDGITWTSRSSAADNDWYGLVFGKGILVATAIAGGSGDRVMTSP